jgi:hypothetical protein
VVTDDLDHALDGVGRLDGRQQLAADAEPVDRQGLGQALAQARGSTGTLGSEAGREGFQLVLGLVGVSGRPGRAQPPLAQGPPSLREVVEDVTFLVPAASLEQRLRPEGAADRGGQGLAAVDDEQHPTLGIQAAVTNRRETAECEVPVAVCSTRTPTGSSPTG